MRTIGWVAVVLLALVLAIWAGSYVRWLHIVRIDSPRWYVVHDGTILRVQGGCLCINGLALQEVQQFLWVCWPSFVFGLGERRPDAGFPVTLGERNIGPCESPTVSTQVLLSSFLAAGTGVASKGAGPLSVLPSAIGQLV